MKHNTSLDALVYTFNFFVRKKNKAETVVGNFLIEILGSKSPLSVYFVLGIRVGLKHIWQNDLWTFLVLLNIKV